MKRALNDPPTGEPPIEISPEADAAMRELKEIFSDPKIHSTASFRCCTEGPTELSSSSSQSLMTNSAMMQTANTSNGSGDFMS
jgi:hypothetical protein